ncbi:MAG: DUF4412 domain-containing protein [Lacibacter sp.]|jgi:GLPGLI family protein
MKLHIAIFLLLTPAWLQPAGAQRLYNEGSVVYNIVVSTGTAKPQAADLLDGARMRIWIKGNQSRTETKSVLGTTITLQDARTGNAVVLNEYGDQKVMITMTREEFQDRNQKFKDMKLEYLDETKTILGYNCKLAIATLTDGSRFRVYYAPDLVFQNMNVGMQFDQLPGFPLEYESEMGSMKVTYVAEKVSFDPIPAALFDVPRSGYRRMTYEELRRTQRN